MRLLILILISQIALTAPSQGFLWFGKKKPVIEKEILLNEEVLINNKYKSKDGIFEIKLAIHIPPNGDEVKIISFDDELNELQIDQVNWLVEKSPNKKITHRLFKPDLIKPYETKVDVNEVYENYAVDFNPDKAYDRIAEDKHIINKSFSFHKSEIFQENKEKIAHFLEITFSNGMKKSIRIEEKIYQEPINVMTGVFPKQGEDSEHNPYAKYEEILKGNQGLDEDQAAEAAKQAAQDFGDGGYSPLEYKVLPEAGIPEGQASDFYTDMSPDGQDMDESILELYGDE